MIISAWKRARWYCKYKNGWGDHAILDTLEYKKEEATNKLLSELSKGRQAGDKEGWLSIDDINHLLEETRQDTFEVSDRIVSEIYDKILIAERQIRNGELLDGKR